jgi:hypothetical protein
MGTDNCNQCRGATFLWRHTRLKNGNSVREPYPCHCQNGAWRLPGTEHMLGRGESLMAHSDNRKAEALAAGV